MAATFSSSSALAAGVSHRVSAGWEGDVETAWGDEFAHLIEGVQEDQLDPDAVVLTAGDEDFYDLGEREFTVEIDDDTGERFLDVEQAGPRDRRAEAQEYLEQAMTSGRSLVRQSASLEDDGNLFPTRNEAVDRLLASPAYGERWARVWLDLARYADSRGYGSDPLRTIWRARLFHAEALAVFVSRPHRHAPRRTFGQHCKHFAAIPCA